MISFFTATTLLEEGAAREEMPTKIFFYLGIVFLAA
jgi:hypothetical protein